MFVVLARVVFFRSLACVCVLWLPVCALLVIKHLLTVPMRAEEVWCDVMTFGCSRQLCLEISHDDMLWIVLGS